MKLKRGLYFVLAFTLIAIGVFIGKWVEIPYLKIEPSINLLHGLSLLTTLFIALVITLVFDTHKKRDGVLKEIMIKRVDMIIDTLDELQHEVSAGKVGLLFACAFPKRLNGAITHIWKAFQFNKIKVNLEKEEIITIVRELRVLLTSTPPKTEKPLNNELAYVENDFLVYSVPKTAEIITVIEMLKDKFFQIQLDINAN